MKAIAVIPGKPGSAHLAELPKPSVSDVPNGRGVLVKVLRVGVDGTDREINAAEYGAAPDGYDFLIIGHEGFGQVEAVGPQVSFLRPGDFVVANKVMVGSVNASRENFETGVRDMSQAEAEYPGWLRRLLTDPVPGLDHYDDLFERLQNPNGAIKIYCDVS